MGIEQGLNLTTQIFQNTNVIMDSSFLLSGIILLLSLILITRNLHNWKFLALPLTIILSIAGLKTHIFIWCISFIAFGFGIVTKETFNKMIEAVTPRYKEKKRMGKVKDLLGVTRLAEAIRAEKSRKKYFDQAIGENTENQKTEPPKAKIWRK